MIVVGETTSVEDHFSHSTYVEEVTTGLTTLIDGVVATTVVLDVTSSTEEVLVNADVELSEVVTGTPDVLVVDVRIGPTTLDVVVKTEGIVVVDDTESEVVTDVVTDVDESVELDPDGVVLDDGPDPANVVVVVVVDAVDVVDVLAVLDVVDCRTGETI